MTGRLTIKAAPGRRATDPATGRLVTRRAMSVPDTSFWRRRLAEGDVLQTQSGRAAPKPEKQGSDS